MFICEKIPIILLAPVQYYNRSFLSYQSYLFHFLLIISNSFLFIYYTYTDTHIHARAYGHALNNCGINFETLFSDLIRSTTNRNN